MSVECSYNTTQISFGAFNVLKEKFGVFKKIYFHTHIYAAAVV